MNKSDKDRCVVSALIHNCIPASDCSQCYLRFNSAGVAHSALRGANAACPVAANIRVQRFLLGKSCVLPALTGGVFKLSHARGCREIAGTLANQRLFLLGSMAGSVTEG